MMYAIPPTTIIGYKTHIVTGLLHRAPATPTATGNTATVNEELSLEEAIQLLDAVRARTDEVADAGAKDQLVQALKELRTEAARGIPDTGEINKKSGKLKAAAAVLGVPALSSAVAGVVEVFTALAVSGTFG